MGKQRDRRALNRGLGVAGPVLSRSEARVLARETNKSVEQVMSRALDRGMSLGSALVNTYNRSGAGQNPYGTPPENLTGLAGLRLERGQVYSGSSPVTVNGTSSQAPIVVARQTVSPGYNPQSGGSTTSLIPGIKIDGTNEVPVPGQVPAAPASSTTPEQAQNIENLQNSVRTRAERMKEFRNKIQEAEQQGKQLRADNKARSAAEESQRNQSLAEERSRSAELEKEFRTRLSNIQTEYAASRQNRTNTPAEDRQSRMISEFERASRKIEKNPNYRLGEFRDRFSDFEPVPGNEEVSADGSEDAASPLTYQDLLNRLKSYRQGGF